MGGRVVGLRELDRLQAVGGLADHLDAQLAGQDDPEAGPDQALVIGDYDSESEGWCAPITRGDNESSAERGSRAREQPGQWALAPGLAAA